MGEEINYLGEEGLDTLIDETKKELDKRAIKYELCEDGNGIKILHGIKPKDKTDYIYYDYKNYSAEEKVIGQWIDGRPIYEKTLYNFYQGRSTTVLVEDSVPHNIQNIDTIIDVKGFYRKDVNFSPLNRPVPNTNYIMYGFAVSLTTENVIISYGADRSGWYVTLTIQYTKTTDQPNSFDLSMITNDVITLEAEEEDVDDVLSMLGGN